MNTKKLAARNRRARRNLALKLQLEITFKRELRAYFSKIRKKIFNHYIDTGEILPIKDFQNSTVQILRRQYRRTSRAFTNEMRLFISKNLDVLEFEKKQDLDDEKIKDVVIVAAAIFIVDQSLIRATPIDRTTIEQASESISNATQELIENGNEITQVAVGLIAAKKFKTKSNGRIDTIAITETQFSSEAIKEIEAAAIVDKGDVNPVQLARSPVIGSPRASKEWATILDQVTRLSHVIADGQKVPMTEPFVVQGELLRRPADTSLGASASNTINCRCSALYSL